MEQRGRVVLVTGAASGIGRVTALRFARDGARLALMDLQPWVERVAAEATALGAQALAWTLDVADEDAVEAAVSEIERRLGPIACLVNAAAIVDHIAPLEKMKPERWRQEIAVNLGGPFNTIRAIAPGMAARGFGRIVNVSSAAARGGLMLQAGYAASKSGLLGLTRNVTLEFARHGVTCNAILPGMIATEKVLAMPEPIREAAKAAAPARRFGTPDEVAALIAFLCSDEAGFINGAEIDITGGLHLSTLALAGSRDNSGPKSH
jgi:NAD(P)-dependent dehydrogenase (short-subunit alcohol dehydrogenase family)